MVVQGSPKPLARVRFLHSLLNLKPPKWVVFYWEYVVDKTIYSCYTCFSLITSRQNLTDLRLEPLLLCHIDSDSLQRISGHYINI